MTSNLHTASRRELLAECRTLGIRGGSIDTETIRAALLKIEAVNAEAAKPLAPYAVTFKVGRTVRTWTRFHASQEAAVESAQAVLADEFHGRRWALLSVVGQ